MRTNARSCLSGARSATGREQSVDASRFRRSKPHVVPEIVVFGESMVARLVGGPTKRLRRVS